MRQFADGELMRVLKNSFSIRSVEIDQARAMLESMAKDLAASVYGRGMIKPNGQAQAQGTPQTQNAQLAQQPQQSQPAQPSQPAPLNAANLEKNTQALSKSGHPKANSKANQAPAAPTTAQPPFPFGASSPHGNPSYMGKPKELNLQLPQSRKKPKITGQTPQGATPSPQLGKNPSPDMRRVSEPQVPSKPFFVCKESDCDTSTVGFSSEQALSQHVQDEHKKPQEDPLKFVQENLALVLGLESDGTVKKEQKAQEAAPAMHFSASKQGQTPAGHAATPSSNDISIKQSASSMGRPQDSKSGIKGGVTPKPGDAKLVEASSAEAAAAEAWANSTIDPMSLINNLEIGRAHV